MTDSEILDEVYQKLERSAGGNVMSSEWAIRRFIEQEWQRRDMEEYERQLNKEEVEKSLDKT